MSKYRNKVIFFQAKQWFYKKGVPGVRKLLPNYLISVYEECPLYNTLDGIKWIIHVIMSINTAFYPKLQYIRLIVGKNAEQMRPARNSWLYRFAWQFS